MADARKQGNKQRSVAFRTEEFEEADNAKKQRGILKTAAVEEGQFAETHKDTTEEVSVPLTSRELNGFLMSFYRTIGRRIVLLTIFWRIFPTELNIA